MPLIPGQRPVGLVATVGPTSWGLVSELLGAGATALRVNASHVEPRKLAPLLERLRRQSRDAPIVVDLQGAKMRLGSFEERELRSGELVDFAYAALDAEGELPLPHLELIAASRPGDTLSCDDGRLRLRVEKVSSARIRVRAENAGTLRPRKGINVVEHPVELSDLSFTDRAFLDEAAGIPGLFWAISFMRDGSEAAWLRRRVPKARVVGKVERAEAVARLADLAGAVDAVWICRGDLGAQIGLGALARFVAGLSPAALPVPVWMAGQVMEHLTRHEDPTRSEVCHLFDLVARGYAGIVLSDETAIGADPVRAVRATAELLRELSAP